MSFINYNILPFELHQWAHTNSDSLKCRDTHIELTWLKLGPYNFFPKFFFSYKVDYSSARHPLCKFLEPVSNHRFWHNNEMRSVDLFKFFEKSYQ